MYTLVKQPKALQKYEQSSHIKSSSFQKKQRRRLSSKNVKKQSEPSTNQNLGLHVVARF